MQFYLSLDFAIEQYLLLNGYNLVHVIAIENQNNSHTKEFHTQQQPNLLNIHVSS